MSSFAVVSPCALMGLAQGIHKRPASRIDAFTEINVLNPNDIVSIDINVASAIPIFLLSPLWLEVPYTKCLFVYDINFQINYNLKIQSPGAMNNETKKTNIIL